MNIVLKTKRDMENGEYIQSLYDAFEKIFKEKQDRQLVEYRIDKGKKQSCVVKEILSFIENRQISCHHDWGNKGTLIFQLEIAYFHYKYKNKEYVYSIGLQLQESLLKINCAQNPYLDSTPEGICDIKPIFKKHKNSIFDGNIGYPKKHAYISITKKIKDIEQYNSSSLCKVVYKILEQSIDLIDSIKQDIKNKGGKFFKYYAITKNGV
jgi:hypothetical protein